MHVNTLKIESEVSRRMYCMYVCVQGIFKYRISSEIKIKSSTLMTTLATRTLCVVHTCTCTCTIPEWGAIKLHYSM